jgi:prolipoprotein diacylglyceryl transferase
MIASIPSPDNGVLHLGPIPLHMYGLMLAVGVLVAVRIAGKRWVARGHELGEFDALVVWMVVGGVIGARLYHVISDYQLFTHDWLRAFQIWRGGLSIWGAVAGGGATAAIIAKRRGLDPGDLADAIAPGLILAQAIGRWGNYFNQELFGAPTSLPWGLEISLHHRPLGYEQYTTFQPTFLYESLYCLAVFGVLLWAERRFRLAHGEVFSLYVALYTAGRFVFEEMRIDPAHTIGPLRLNAWLSLALFVAAVAWFAYLRRRYDRGVTEVPADEHARGLPEA